jgi:hypothetical protein
MPHDQMPVLPGPVTGIFPLGALTTASGSSVGPRLGALQFSATGAALLPAQLAGATLGPDLAGALR